MSTGSNSPEEPLDRRAESPQGTPPPTEAFAVPELAVAPERPRKSNWLLILLFALLAILGALLLWRSFDTAPVQNLESIGAKGYVGSWTDGQQEIQLHGSGDVQGTDDCNSLFGQWEFSDGRVHFSDFSMTEMACIIDDSNEPQPWTGWIAEADSAKLKGATLLFYSGDGTELGAMKKGKVSERPQSAPEFLGTWKSELQQIELTQEGRLAGTDGCNTISSSWKEQGGTISFSPVVSTRMDCTDPETGELIRSWILDAASGLVLEDELTIFDGSGAELGTMKR